VAVSAFSLWISPSNPPGFLPDEASMSYNAYEIAHHLRDENGGLLPLYIRSFGDYKSPVFTYALAAVFRVTGPHSEVARGLAAVGILCAVLLLGLFALRRTGSLVVAGAVVVLAGLTPWLFEVGRAAYEVALEPLIICLFLLGVESSWRKRSWGAARGAAVGLSLTALAFVYAAGRVLAPLFALALLVFFAKARWRWFAACWGTFALTALVPIAAYWARHPGALTERYNQTSFITSSMPPWTIAWRAARNYVHDMNLWHWIVSGDPKPYVHTYGAGSIYASVVLLALGSVALALARRRAERFWLFTVVLLLLCPIPAALTKDRFYGLRLVPLPVLLVVVAIPGIVWLVERLRTGWFSRVVVVALVALVGVQFVHFVDNFRARGWARTVAFHAGVPSLLHEAFQLAGSVNVNQHEPHALVYAKWYAIEHHLPLTSVVLLSYHGVPANGSIVFGRFQPCEYVCAKFARADDYWLARARGPLPSAPAPKIPVLKSAVHTAARVRMTFRTQGRVATAGGPWAYYLAVTRNGKPWSGSASIDVRTPGGDVIDHVGQFPVKGSLLSGYLWATGDAGKKLVFHLTLQENGRQVGTVAYEVFVQSS
jgi:hypothetical protein